MSKKQKENYGSSLKESIKIFNKLTTNGPIYVCSICQQINFLHNVSKIQNLKKHKNNTLLEKCNTHYKSINNIEYICNTCKKYIYKGKVPKLSIENGCGFHNKPRYIKFILLRRTFHISCYGIYANTSIISRRSIFIKWWNMSFTNRNGKNSKYTST